MSTSYHIIPIFVPHIGCPHDCVFCNQKKITGSSTNMTYDEVNRIINQYLKTIPSSNMNLEVAFFGGSFTGIDISIQESLLKAVYTFKKQGLIDMIRLSTRPDYINTEILSLLKRYEVDTIELGVQSMDEDVLRESYRGHSIEDVIKAVDLIKSYGFKLGLQMMIGLPGDSKEKDLNTAKRIIQLKPDFVRIYPTLVIRDTFLAKQFENGKYKPLFLKNAIDICTDLLLLFNFYSINVIRIGLQPTDNIAADKDIIAGPFHPSFRQLVEANIYRLVLDMFFSEIQFDFDNISILVNKKEVSYLVGQNSENIKYWKKTYGISKLKIIKKDIPKDFFYIIYNDRSIEINKSTYEVRYLNDNNLV